MGFVRVQRAAAAGPRVIMTRSSIRSSAIRRAISLTVTHLNSVANIDSDGSVLTRRLHFASRSRRRFSQIGSAADVANNSKRGLSAGRSVNRRCDCDLSPRALVPILRVLTALLARHLSGSTVSHFAPGGRRRPKRLLSVVRAGRREVPANPVDGEGGDFFAIEIDSHHVAASSHPAELLLRRSDVVKDRARGLRGNSIVVLRRDHERWNVLSRARRDAPIDDVAQLSQQTWRRDPVA